MSRLDCDGANLTDSNISMCSYNSQNNYHYIPYHINIRLQNHTPTRSPILMKTYKQYFFSVFTYEHKAKKQLFLSWIQFTLYFYFYCKEGHKDIYLLLHMTCNQLTVLIKHGPNTANKQSYTAAEMVHCTLLRTICQYHIGIR